MGFGEFLYILVIILVAAKILGELCRLVGQPAVLGELLAGIVIGPSVLGLISDASIFSHDNIFYLLAEIGVLLLLFEVGLETELSELIKVGKNSTIIGVLGIIFPFIGSFAFCQVLGAPTMESIMIGAALTATSIGITSKVFEEIGIMQSQAAKIVIGAAIVDDIIALAILGVISAVVQSGEDPTVTMIIKNIGISVLFLVLAIIIGKFLVNHLVSLLDKMKTRGIMLIGAISFALVLSLIAYKIGSSIIIGGFAAGILLAETRKKHVIMEGLKPIVDFFTPIFFVSVGVVVNLAFFNPLDPGNHFRLGVILILVLIALFTKMLPAYLIKTEKGLNRHVVGLGMVPRGEVGLIFASIGLSTGVFNDLIYNGVVAVVVLSTVIVPPLLKLATKTNNQTVTDQ